MSIEIEQPRNDVAMPVQDRMISGLTIRVREPDDCAAVAEIMALPKVSWGTHWMPFASREQTRQWIAGMPEGSIQTVALLEGKLVGTAGIIALTGWRSASFTSALILSTIVFGVPGGATSAYQATASNPARVSAIVGTSGRDARRWAEATASSLRRPASTSGRETPRLSN